METVTLSRTEYEDLMRAAGLNPKTVLREGAQFNPIEEVLKGVEPKEANNVKPDLVKFFSPLEQQFMERCVLKRKPLETLVLECNNIMMSNPSLANVKDRVGEYVSKKDEYTLPFRKRVLLTKIRDSPDGKKIWDMYFVRCKEDEVIWTNEGIITQNFVNFDYWRDDFNFKPKGTSEEVTDRQLLLGKIANICKQAREKETYDLLCFVKKKNSGVEGPISIASELSESVLGNRNYVVYDQNTGQCIDQNGKISNLEGKVCLVYDTAFTGRNIADIQEQLTKRKIAITHAVLLHDHRTGNPQFSFPLSFVIGEEHWMSQRYLNLEYDEDVERALRTQGGRLYRIRFPEEKDRNYGYSIALRSGGVTYASDDLRIVPKSTIEVLDKKGVKYEVV